MPAAAMSLDDHHRRVPCRACREPIRRGARACPHCGCAQSRWALEGRGAAQVQVVVGLVLAILLLPPLGLLLWRVAAVTSAPSEPFAPHRAELVVSELRWHVAPAGDGGHRLALVGTLHNEGEHAWTALVLEARLLDADGRLLDVLHARSDQVAPAGGPTAFRVVGAAARPPGLYASADVVVTDASEVRHVF